MKAKFHYYMALLLYMEICDGAGHLLIKDLECEMSQHLRDAIMENEKAFFAGSLGPDFYPDMLVGKLRIHPKKNINPGLWLVMMIEDFRNSYDPTKSENKEAREVFAFIAGWMTHYACDVFMNTYVNGVTGGYFFGDAKTPPDTKEAKAFFRAVETYLEIKLEKNPLLRLNEIKAPAEYLKRFFLEDRRVCFNSASSRSEFIFKKPKEDKSKPYLPAFSSAKSAKDTASEKDTKSEQSSTAEETPEEVAMLDYSEESLDIFFLLGGIRKVFYYDERAPYDEQPEIGKKITTKRDRQKSLKNTDILINDWLSLFEKLAGDVLMIKADNAGAFKERLAKFKLDLDEFEKRLKTIMYECGYLFIDDGLPQWLLDYLLRKNILNLGELAGQLKSGDGGPVTSEIGIKIKGPFTPAVKQTNNIILNMCSEVIPKMMEKIYKNVETSLMGGDPEPVLTGKWDKEEFDENLGNFGPEVYYTCNQTFTPFADALMLAKLCLLGKSFDEVVKQVHERSHKYIQWLYKKPKEGKFDLIEPKSFPASTQRLRVNLKSGDSTSVREISVMYGPNDLLVVKNEKAYNHIYLQFEKYTKYTDFISVTFTVQSDLAKGPPEEKQEEKQEEKPGEKREESLDIVPDLVPDDAPGVVPDISPDNSTEIKSEEKQEDKPEETTVATEGEKPKTKYEIIIEAEDLKFKGKWKPLVNIEGALTSAEECKVEYTKNLPDNVEQSNPIVDSADGEFRITIPITYKKVKKKEKEEKPRDEYDIYLGVFNFLKSLEAGKEWTKLEKDHPPYFYFLNSLMHLTDKCYR